MEIKRIDGGALDAIILPLIKKQQPVLNHPFEAMVLQSTLKTECVDQHFKRDDISPLQRPRPAACPWDPELSPHTQVLGAEMDRAGSRGQAAGRGESADMPLAVDQFIQSTWAYAKNAARRIGLDPKVLMAQVALETGWGQFIAKKSDGSSSNNLFNIKSGVNNADDTVKINTSEYIDNAPVKMMASFKAYPSIEHSFHDYMALIEGNHRYQSAVANADAPKQYIDALYKAGYATDPNYAEKILSIYEGHALQQALKRNGCV